VGYEDNYCGFGVGDDVGIVSRRLKGDGVFTLKYGCAGNPCSGSVSVNLYQYSEGTVKHIETTSKSLTTVSYYFHNNDLLSVVEDPGTAVIESLTFECDHKPISMKAVEDECMTRCEERFKNETHPCKAFTVINNATCRTYGPDCVPDVWHNVVGVAMQTLTPDMHDDGCLRFTGKYSVSLDEGKVISHVYLKGNSSVGIYVDEFLCKSSVALPEASLGIVACREPIRGRTLNLVTADPSTTVKLCGLQALGSEVGGELSRPDRYDGMELADLCSESKPVTSDVVFPTATADVNGVDLQLPRDLRGYDRLRYGCSGTFYSRTECIPDPERNRICMSDDYVMVKEMYGNDESRRRRLDKSSRNAEGGGRLGRVEGRFDPRFR
jgi:hypothetical protein